MWMEFMISVYQLIRRFFFSNQQQQEAVDLISKAPMLSLPYLLVLLQTLYRGKAYVALRIPDPDTASPQHIDLVHVTQRKVVVVYVVNKPVTVSVKGDGTWFFKYASNHKTEHLHDPVVEAKRQVAVIESYLEQRGVTLPEGNISYKIICPNPNFRYEV
ncbi:uncharacterized protein LOC143601607 [Bidens hawaiensis]|uniref:uncharacterized protein LOC143601607 n=1 Tax=Bidens hawaiensis TaxID=980011 RepID=UPI004049D1EE